MKNRSNSAKEKDLLVQKGATRRASSIRKDRLNFLPFALKQQLSGSIRDKPTMLPMAVGLGGSTVL